MNKFLGLFLVLLLLFAPIIFISFRQPLLSRYVKQILGIPSNTQNSAKYEAVNESKKQVLKIVDTSYLDFIASNFGLFEKNVIIDPKFYIEGKKNDTKYTISKIEFKLIDDMPQYVYAATGPTNFASKGNYQINGDTLIIVVSLFTDQIPKNTIINTYKIEEVFLKTVFTTLLYAKGLSTPNEMAVYISDISEGMDKYLKSGLFAWPIEVQEL